MTQATRATSVPPAGTSPEEALAGRLLACLSVLGPHLREITGHEARPADLGLGAARALMLIAHAKADVAVGDLAAQLGLPLPRVSKLLGDLEARGLIVRARAPDDRRRVTVRLSRLGRRSFEALRAAQVGRLSGGLLQVLGAADTEALVGILERAAERLAPGSPGAAR